LFDLKQIKEETPQLCGGTDTPLSHNKTWTMPLLLKSTVKLSIQFEKSA